MNLAEWTMSDWLFAASLAFCVLCGTLGFPLILWWRRRKSKKWERR